VWAFAITSVEIWTNAATPYKGWMNAFVLEQVGPPLSLPPSLVALPRLGVFPCFALSCSAFFLLFFLPCLLHRPRQGVLREIPH
jgi:hypothetical protein